MPEQRERTAGQRVWPARIECRLAAMLVATVAAPGPAAAQTLRVIVTDSLTGAPLAGATIRTLDTAGAVQSTTSDTLGTATLTLGHLGPYTVTVHRVGFQAWESREVLIQEAPDSTFRVLLVRVAVTLPSIEVAERADRYLGQVGFYDRERLGQGHHMDPAAVEALAGRSRTVTDLLAMVPGAQIVSTTAGRMGTLPHLTGVLSLERPCTTPRVLIDGIVVLRDHAEDWDPKLPGRVPIETLVGLLDSAITPTDVLAIEVYRRPAEIPARYGGSEAACGVILIWSKRGTVQSHQ